MSNRVVYSAVKFRNLDHKISETQSDVVYSEVRICGSVPTQRAPSCEQTVRKTPPMFPPETLSTETSCAGCVGCASCAGALRYRVAAMCLALLCALLLAVIAHLWASLNRAKEHHAAAEGRVAQLDSNCSLLAEQRGLLQGRYSALQDNCSSLAASKVKLQESYDILLVETGQLREKCNKIKIKADICGPCPCGWKMFGYNCYYVSGMKWNWHDSKSYCGRYDAHLVTINDNQELLFIQRLIGSDSYWIGLTYKGNSETWMWEDNTPMKEGFWVQGSQYSDKPCAYYDLSRNRWISAYCYQKFFWICETEAMELY